MDQEKIGKFIKDLRIKNNLTQKAFADKYNVTYQAVSKWENGKNMPDLSLLKEICKDFDVSLDDLINGEKSVKKSYKKYVIICIIFIVIVLFLVIDGRRVDSVGASVADLAKIMLRYGAYNAANLDGGNSSVLVVNNKIINRPINWSNMEATRPIATGFILQK